MRFREYPRLRITRRYVSVLLTIGPGHRGYGLKRFWVVVLCKSPGDETVVQIGRDDGVYGWVDCCDYAQDAIRRAKAQGFGSPKREEEQP
jgi:hypothetical protein